MEEKGKVNVGCSSVKRGWEAKHSLIKKGGHKVEGGGRAAVVIIFRWET